YYKLQDFNVASWWSGERDIPSQFQGIEFTNVPLLEVASSGYVEYGEMEVILRKITFRRLYISKENLLLTTIAMWLSSALIYLVMQISLYQYQLNKAKVAQSRLLEIMHALKLEKSEMNKMAKRDALTGLRNRAGLSKHFSECGIAHTENNTPFCIVFIDIDFFKQVNDIHGHNTGDDVLVSFSQTIYNNIRIADKLGRWGGEEFILICKNCNLESAVAIAEKLCLIVEKKVFPENLKITASFGVAEMKTTESTREFIERADKALYTAKSSGRNQVQASE
ncbi:MAG: GGDEF domain-containing protein, partial [Alteromonadales bacterium]|nr:GGDEF domain-containing protein [Alteromonadales bacterium]